MADDRLFRRSLAASAFLNIGLLALGCWLGRTPDLSAPQARPHVRLVTVAVRPAPPSSARRGVRAAARLAAPTPAAPISTPISTPPPRRVSRRPAPEAAAPTPPPRVLTARRSPARVFLPPVPRIEQEAARPPAFAAAPPRDAPTFAPPTFIPPPTPTAPPPTSLPTPRPAPAQREAGRGASGAGAGGTAGAGDDTSVNAGGPFGIGDGLESSGVTRHVVYVLDTSGSMAGRMAWVEQALLRALDGLRPGETFNIVTFSGRSRLFDPDMADATPGEVQSAASFLRGLAAAGDTDLESAVVRALMLRDVNEVVILTDGVPTVGETDPDRLASDLRRFNLRRARISTIGLAGGDPAAPGGRDGGFAAARLLARIARDSGGASKLVAAGDAAR